MSNLGNLLEEMADDEPAKNRDQIKKAPFAWPGGKTRSIKYILPYLPRTGRYVSVFGGSGIDLLARAPEALEVFNDRYGGVVDFYRCLRNPLLFDRLCAWLQLTVHSREEFVFCKSHWEQTEDPVVRAGMWYYMTTYSFAHLGRNWGRCLGVRGVLGNKIRKKLVLFDQIHQRLRDVQIENQDWYDCIRDYDHPDTVFYLDPPYVDSAAGIYRHGMSHDDHRRLLGVVENLQGFAAVSGYPNPLYDGQSFWDDRVTWESYVSMESMAFTEANHKAKLQGQTKRTTATEVLWIKEAQ